MKDDYRKAISVVFPDHIHIHHITTKEAVLN